MERGQQSAAQWMDQTRFGDLDVFSSLQAPNEDRRSGAISDAFSQFAATLKVTPLFDVRTIGYVALSVRLIKDHLRGEKSIWNSDDLHDLNPVFLGTLALRESPRINTFWGTEIVGSARKLLSISLFLYAGGTECGYGEYSAQDVVQTRECVGKELMVQLDQALDTRSSRDGKEKLLIMQSLLMSLFMTLMAMKFRSETTQNHSIPYPEARDLESLLYHHLIQVGMSLTLLKTNNDLNFDQPPRAILDNLPATSTWDILPDCNPEFIHAMTTHRCKLCNSCFRCPGDWDEEEDMGPCCARCKAPPPEPLIPDTKRQNWYLQRKEDDEDPWKFYGEY